MSELKLNVDSSKVREYSLEILKLVDDYNSLIYSLYNELSNISNNEVWVGIGANAWINSLNNDKVSCFLLGKMLYNYGNSLVDFADNIDNTLERCDFDG